MPVQNYVLLERIELNATAASITFSNIPQSGYTDLKIVLSARTDAGSGGYQTYVRFNGDTASNYSWRNLLGTGSAAVSQNSSPDTGMRITMSDSSGDTASTFGNSELYIPNYTSSTAKSVSADGVSENNATAATTDLAAGLWTGTAAITSVTIFASGANLVSGSTFSLYGIANSSTTPVVAPKATGGNVIGTDGTYWWHIFNANGTFTPLTNLNCDYLVVAGGGASANNRNGGGGGGGVRYGSSLALASNTSFAVTVGAGGAGGASNIGATSAQKGNNSSISTISATGGGWGGGGDPATYPAGAGGSGGGGVGGWGANNAGGSGNQGAYTPVEGYSGGSGINDPYQHGGGGGGAGGAGGSASSTVSGAGGVGYTSSISGTSVMYGAGGSGGARSTYGTAGSVSSGGGQGASANNTPGAAGGTNRGGGAGGGGEVTSGTYTNANGGSGIVIVRYTVA